MTLNGSKLPEQTKEEKQYEKEWLERERNLEYKRYVDKPSKEENKRIKDIPKSTNPYRKRIMTETIKKEEREKREDFVKKYKEGSVGAKMSKGGKIPITDARKRGGK